MIGDPYEEADEKQRQLDEAKLVTPEPAKKNRKIVMVGLVAVGLLVGILILANIAHFFIGSRSDAGSAAPKPTTMTKRDGDSFARQQGGEAKYMQGVDGRKKQGDAEDTVLGNATALAADPYEETPGVPKKTKAQDDAEHGRNDNGQAPEKSEAQQRAEKAALEAAHRKQNDLDSSPVSVDFSDYFDKEKTAANTVRVVAKDEETAQPRRHTPLNEDDASADDQPSGEQVSTNKKGAHDPSQDYEFDQSFGKLYRLMEDNIIESVLVNRLTGAAAGPVITMVTTDVYSLSNGHLLIPKGTRMLGRVSAVAGMNQERLFVAFHRMIMPDGYSVSLDKFQGLDVVGQTGLRDLVNHHYLVIFGSSLALAAIAATAQIGNSVGAYGSYGASTQLRNGMSESLGQSANRVLERFMSILPTFTIRERARVKIMLSNDLLLPDIKNQTMDADL